MLLPKPGSLTTVSRVLNNRGYLSQATRDKVAACTETLGYRPNQVARALHGKSAQIIGLIVPTVALPFFGELAAEVLEWTQSHGIRVPDEFRVAGFDGTMALRRALPGLTTIQQQIAAIARRAVEILLTQIARHQGPPVDRLARMEGTELEEDVTGVSNDDQPAGIVEPTHGWDDLEERIVRVIRGADLVMTPIARVLDHARRPTRMTFG